jgi:hypothetical protein
MQPRNETFNQRRFDMNKLRRYVHLDDALFVLALAIPALFAVARYVETAAETSAIVLAQQPHKDVVVKAVAPAKTEVAQSDVEVR